MWVVPPKTRNSPVRMMKCVCVFWLEGAELKTREKKDPKQENKNKSQQHSERSLVCYANNKLIARTKKKKTW